MALPSAHIKDVLVAGGYTFGGTGNWAVYIGTMPSTPVQVITIYDAPGLAPNPKWLLDYPSIQIKVRGGPNDYSAAYNKIRELSERLIGKPAFNALDGSGDRIVMINGIGSIAYLERDENQRHVFVMNLSLIIEPAATANSQRSPL